MKFSQKRGVSSQERTACEGEVFAGLCGVSGSGIDSVDQRVAQLVKVLVDKCSSDRGKNKTDNC
ncbi:hypothetical protein Pint_17404 [Pistacia integerrima]|uniref:Uncharacterized protein n=1 Tax=Pistacia integerrima TaxID=434235 RepID=A0ACC0YZH9_9ROSI|nr:hypothetical protein Pint_17404 [Pistacia integerrima]